MADDGNNYCVQQLLSLNRWTVSHSFVTVRFTACSFMAVSFSLVDVCFTVTSLQALAVVSLVDNRSKFLTVNDYDAANLQCNTAAVRLTVLR